MIPGSANPLLLASAAGGYAIERSVRLNSADSAYFSRTPASSGNRKTWTWAGWVKRSGLGEARVFCSGNGTSGNTEESITFGSSNNVSIENVTQGVSVNWNISTNAVFRDVSAWAHICVAVDTTQATAGNRLKLYVNGTQVTSLSTANYPSQNTDTTTNSTALHTLGISPVANNRGFNGCLADIYFCDGYAYDPSYFTEFDDNGILQPIAFTGSYGTNGFHLPFDDNSTAAALGTDTSGQGNNWTPNNLSVTSTNINYGSFISFENCSLGGGAIANGFDTSTSTGFNTTNAVNSTIVFTPNFDLTIASSLVFYGALGGNQGWSVKIGSTTLASGTNQPGSPYTIPNAAGKTINASNPLRLISNGSGEAVYFNALLVDGVLLVNNAGPGCDSLVDVPSNGTETDTGVGGEVRGNYCTLNPLSNTAGSLSNGNLDQAGTSSTYVRSEGTIAVSSGKWYFEITVNSLSGTYASIGVGTVGATNKYPGEDATSYAWYPQFVNKQNNSSASAYGSAVSAGGVIMVALDLDNNKVFFGGNGTWFGSSNPATGANPAYTVTAGTYTPIARAYDTGSSFSFNFGQRPFAYTAPSGFKAICTANLPAPVVTKPSTVMDVKLYTGNGSTQTISGLGFSPDLVWIKTRSAVANHRWLDTIRGATKELYGNLTNAEGTDASGLTAFNSDGFSLGNSSGYNDNAVTHAAWCWDAGSSTVTNTAGSITSSVRANPSAGFSIVTYTATNTATATVGHGLGVAPSMWIIKPRNATANWHVYHASLGSSNVLLLNGTNSVINSVYTSSSVAPTSSVFTVKTGGVTQEWDNYSTRTHVAYCFAPVAGYSSFGKYTGNGSADGPFVYTGFRPRWIMVKASSIAGSWYVFDTARDTYNAAAARLVPNTSSGESTSQPEFDLLSNGFKLRGTDTAWNGSGSTYVYAAFAESPFQYARAR